MMIELGRSLLYHEMNINVTGIADLAVLAFNRPEFGIVYEAVDLKSSQNYKLEFPDGFETTMSLSLTDSLYRCRCRC